MQIRLVPATPEVLASFSDLKTRTPTMIGSFIAETTRVVLKVLESPVDVECVLAPQEWYDEYGAQIATSTQATLYVAPKAILANIVGFNLHEGVMARAKVPADVPLIAFKNKPLIVLDGITKAENVGAIVRNATAFGVWNILLGPNSCHPYNRRSARVAMGNLFRMKVHQARDLPAALKELRTLGTHVYAFENRPFAKDIDRIEFSAGAALVIGSEGEGVSKGVLDQADHYVRIPIDEHVFALNAASASAVGLYAFSRQHGSSRT